MDVSDTSYKILTSWDINVYEIPLFALIKEYPYILLALLMFCVVWFAI